METGKLPIYVFHLAERRSCPHPGQLWGPRVRVPRQDSGGDQGEWWYRQSAVVPAHGRGQPPRFETASHTCLRHWEVNPSISCCKTDSQIHLMSLAIWNIFYIHYRCKKHRNPKYFGVLAACEGDGTEIPHMKKLEEKLAADASDKKVLAKRMKKKGRKNKWASYAISCCDLLCAMIST